MVSNPVNMIKRVVQVVNSNSSTILTGLAVGGVISTFGLTVDGTLKAVKSVRIEEDLRQKDAYVEGYDQPVPLSKVDILKLVWKDYFPAVGMALGTIFCVVGLNSVHLRRNAALISLYEFTDNALREYKKKVVETIGEKKELDIRDAIAQDHLNNNPINHESIIVTSAGNTLCYESISGRYFRSDVDKILRAQNEFNSRLLKDMVRPLNEFYDEIGLEPIGAGDNMGWAWEYGMMEIRFSSKLAKDNNPCLVLEYKNGPRAI